MAERDKTRMMIGASTVRAYRTKFPGRFPSSTAAILGALEKRSSALGKEGEATPLFIDRGEDWAELTGEEQYEMLGNVRGPAWATERIEVSQLLKLAREWRKNPAAVMARLTANADDPG